MTNSSPFSAHIKERLYSDYLCSLFLPTDQRHAYHILLALADELARIREVTTDPSTGFIRLLWWKEALDDLFDNHIIRGHALLEALAPITEQYNLPKAPFMHLIEAREHDISHEPFADAEALANHAQSITLPVWQLAAHIAQKPLPNHAPELARHTGVITLLSQWPAYAQSGYIIFPADHLRTIGTHAQAVSDGLLHHKKLLDIARTMAKQHPITISKNEIKKHPILMKSHLASRQQKRLANKGLLTQPLSALDYLSLWRVSL